MPVPRRTAMSAVAAAALLLAGCTGESGDESDADASPSDSATPTTVVLVTHDSLTPITDVLERFEKESGLTVELNTVDDVGTLADRLVSQEQPLGDVVLGVDNTFLTRVDDTVTEVNYLWPVGEADVCVNADKAWFAHQGLPVPRTLDDLIDPRYQGLLVVPDPGTSSLGLAFLLAGVDEYGDTQVGDYWTALRENGVKIADSAQDAYDGEFTAADGSGDRPLVVSYSTSPVSTTGQNGEPSTVSLPETCFRHEEYAGVLAGAKNRQGAKDLLWFLVSDAAQQKLPGSLSLYPAKDSTKLPGEWADLPERAQDPHELDPEEIAENREAWIEAWNAILG